jgi:phospholipase/carboxylesterase
MKDVQLPHLKILFPTAPERPYTLLGGEFSHVWFDRLSISPDVPEHAETLESIGQDVTNFIQQQVINTGIPEDRIIVGGFSMGGALAMHVGFRLMRRVAGVFALSSFLSHTSSIYQSIGRTSRDLISLPPLFMCHGDRDTLVPHEWGQHTFNRLRQLGVHGEFHTIHNALHEMKEKELRQLYIWINRCLPPPV